MGHGRTETSETPGRDQASRGDLGMPRRAYLLNCLSAGVHGAHSTSAWHPLLPFLLLLGNPACLQRHPEHTFPLAAKLLSSPSTRTPTSHLFSVYLGVPETLLPQPPKCLEVKACAAVLVFLVCVMKQGLIKEPWLALNAWRSACLYLPNAEIKGMGCHTCSTPHLKKTIFINS